MAYKATMWPYRSCKFPWKDGDKSPIYLYDFSKIEHITTLIPHAVMHLSEKFNLSAASVQRLHIKVGNHWTYHLLIKFFKHNCKTDL